MDRRTWLLASVLAAGLVAGCGGDDAPRRAMVPQAPAARAHGGPNQAPVVQSVKLSPRRPMPGEPVNAVVEVLDADGDQLQVRYQWQVNRRAIQGGGPRLDGAHLAKGDRVSVSVVASDGRLESEPFRAEVRYGNRPPRVLGVTFDPATDVKPGDVLTALVDASDEDEDPLRIEYRWLVNGDETSAKGRTFDTSGLRREDRVQVRVRAGDGDDRSSDLLSPPLVLGNRPPEIVGVPPAERDGDAFRYRFEARDPDGDRSLRFSLGEAPAGMTIDPIYGVATWRPTHEQAGTQRIEVRVADSQGASTTLQFEVTVSSTERPVGSAAAAPEAPPANATP